MALRRDKRDKAVPDGRRSEIVSVRLDPRLKYLAELAARKQRRPLSGFIEWAVEQVLRQVELTEADDRNLNGMSVADAEKRFHLWDVEEADRVIRLAFNFPDLLTFDEQVTWKLVKECGYVWRGGYSGPEKTWKWEIEKFNVIEDRLRKHWDTFKKVAAGELPASALPEWADTNPASTSSSSSLDDEIPF
jgi:hypothetical protein